jgi:ketosteroid isomerase-like protein
MIRVLALALMLAASPLLAAAQKTSNSADDKSMILALESARNQAEIHHDATAATAIMADAFISVDHHGALQSKQEYLAGLKDKSILPTEIANSNTSVYRYGNVAIVTSEYRTKGTDGGKPFVHHGRFTDTWVKLNGEWKWRRIRRL